MHEGRVHHDFSPLYLFDGSVNGGIGREKQMTLGKHSDDLAFLVAPVPTDFVQCRLVFGFGDIGVDGVAPGFEAGSRGISTHDKLSALDTQVGVLVGKEPHPGDGPQPLGIVVTVTVTVSVGAGNIVLALEVVKHVGKGVADNIVHVQIIDELDLV